MFLGKFTTEFSGKNRLVLPKKIRKEFGIEERFYIKLGSDGEIWGFDKDNWQAQTGEILRISLSLAEGRAKRRLFFSQAEECVLDTQGRFILPQEFVEECELQMEILIIGAGDHFEIWNKTSWEKVIGQIQDEVKKIKTD